MITIFNQYQSISCKSKFAFMFLFYFFTSLRYLLYFIYPSRFYFIFYLKVCFLLFIYSTVFCYPYNSYLPVSTILSKEDEAKYLSCSLIILSILSSNLSNYLGTALKSTQFRTCSTSTLNKFHNPLLAI